MQANESVVSRASAANDGNDGSYGGPRCLTRGTRAAHRLTHALRYQHGGGCHPTQPVALALATAQSA